MERIKAALDKARDQRHQAIKEDAEKVHSNAASGTILGKARILEREPFCRYSADEQDNLLLRGRVVNVAAGETLQFAGDNDDYVHYLLAGAVILESEHNEKITIAANHEAAQRPLDRSGVKRYTISAATDAEILKVPGDALPGAADTAPVPREAYSETYSGQQLADLVEQINVENDGLEDDHRAATATDAEALLASDEAASFNDLSASAESLLADIEITNAEEDPGAIEPSYVPEKEDELGRFARDLEARFRRYVDKVKADERARYEAQLQRHVANLKVMAERQIKTSLLAQRERYQKVLVEKDSRLRERYSNLRNFANKIAQQKAAIYVARRQIHDKLRAVEKIHTELSRLGNQLDHQLDDLDEQMPDTEAGSSLGASDQTSVT